MFDPKTKILILDDMLTMRKIVAKALRDMGFSDITEANDGKDGWEKLSSAEPPFQLVISDWNMPNMTGLELLRKVRADGKYAKIPFVLLTAEAEAGQVAEAVKIGVSNYVLKPFTADQLKGKLEQVYKKLPAAG